MVSRSKKTERKSPVQSQSWKIKIKIQPKGYIFELFQVLLVFLRQLKHVTSNRQSNKEPIILRIKRDL